MEYFFHLSYRLEIKKWRVTGNDRETMKIRKREIQKRFRLETGLIIDKPKPGGSGTSNDGNTARRFFYNTDKTATITGLDIAALKRCSAILQVPLLNYVFHPNTIVERIICFQLLASGSEINVERFSDFCFETVKYLVQLYPWYYMLATVHKVLIHGAQVIENFSVPIG